MLLRLSIALVAVLALTGALTFAVSPASALTGEAFNKCMAKCKADSANRFCDYWCEKRY